MAILGADSYLAEGALEVVLANAVGADRSSAVTMLRGDESTWTQVADAARSPSLFSERAAVVVRDADRLKGDDAVLAGVLDDPAPGITLVLVAAKPDARRRIWKKIQSKGRIVAADPLRGRALRSRVVQELESRALSIDADGLESLLDRVGADLRRLVGEIEKLEAYAAPRRRLTIDDVAATLGKGLARPLYRLSDALIERQPIAALSLLDEILDEGEAAPLVLSALLRAIRQVRGVRALGRASAAELAARLRIPPFKIEDLRRAARSWSPSDLKAAVRALIEADTRIKTGIDPRTALTAAVVACARRPALPGPAPSDPRPSGWRR